MRRHENCTEGGGNKEPVTDAPTGMRIWLGVGALVAMRKHLLREIVAHNKNLLATEEDGRKPR
jgi:hypothetical protein